MFFIGSFMLLGGVTMLAFFPYFFFIEAPVICFGLLLVLFSKKHWKHKLIPMGISASIIMLFLYVVLPLHQKKISGHPEIFLIPKGYEGKVTIIFKKGCGSRMNKTEEGFVYNIPKSGILLLDHEKKDTIINYKYYFIDEEGHRDEVQRLNTNEVNDENINKNRAAVFYAGKTGRLIKNKNGVYRTHEFYVSSFAEFSKSFDYEVTFEKRIENELDKCK